MAGNIVSDKQLPLKKQMLAQKSSKLFTLFIIDYGRITTDNIFLLR